MGIFNSFYFYDVVFLVVFSLFVFNFLHKRRKKLDKEGWLYLYRTSWGIKFIEYIGEKYPGTLKALSYLAVFTGYILMILIMYFFGFIIYVYAKMPQVATITKIPPIFPLIPYLPNLFKLDFLPPFFFTYWIIIIALIAIVHEFGHGIFARFYNVRVKSTGFGFLGPFLAAFVEPDEKDMQAKKIFPQLAILSAGVLMNVITAFIFICIIWTFLALAFTPIGVTFDGYTFKQIPASEVYSVNGIPTSNVQYSDIFGKSLNETEKARVNINGGYYIYTYKIMQEHDEESEVYTLYADLPAINTDLKGVIVSIDGAPVTAVSELSSELAKHSPGDKINIKTYDGENFKDNEIVLSEGEDGKPQVGIWFLNRQGLSSTLSKYLLFFKEPNVYYQPKIDGVSIFIYNLFWWIILISLSVAMVNMMPASIFDGGRFFYLTAFAVFGNEKIAKRIASVVAWIILFMLILMMYFYTRAFF